MDIIKKRLRRAKHDIGEEIAVAKSFARQQKRKVGKALDKAQKHNAKRELRILKAGVEVLKQQATFVDEAIKQQEKSAS